MKSKIYLLLFLVVSLYACAIKKHAVDQHANLVWNDVTSDIFVLPSNDTIQLHSYLWLNAMPTIDSNSTKQIHSSIHFQSASKSALRKIAIKSIDIHSVNGQLSFTTFVTVESEDQLRIELGKIPHLGTDIQLEVKAVVAGKPINFIKDLKVETVY